MGNAVSNATSRLEEGHELARALVDICNYRERRPWYSCVEREGLAVDDELRHLDEDFQSHDAHLARARAHPNDRDLRRELEHTARSIAGYNLPSKYGPEIDRVLSPVVAQAKILSALAVRANRNVPAREADVVEVAAAIVKLRRLLVPLSAEISAHLRDPYRRRS